MIRAIVVDDEQPSLDKLDKLLGESGLVEVAGKFTEPILALEFLKRNKVDAAFLDIEMPDMDGIELSSRITELQGEIDVIFVTAYNQYAVEAFRLNALDYLMKPVAADRLNETLCRISGEKGLNVYTTGVNVRCFGGFKVAAGACEMRFRTGKAEELLAVFIDRKGGPASRREIIDSLWEDFDGDRALIHFNTTLYYLKKALLGYGIKAAITYDRGSYRFDAENLTCDYFLFHGFMESAGVIDHGNILKYEEAAGLYTGDYLSDKDYEWVQGRRMLLKEQFIRLLIGISEYHKTAGNHKKSIEWLKSGLAHETLHRELNYRLIEALLSANDRLSAIKYYDVYKNGLRKKLGQDPDDGIKRLLGR